MPHYNQHAKVDLKLLVVGQKRYPNNLEIKYLGAFFDWFSIMSIFWTMKIIYFRDPEAGLLVNLQNLPHKIVCICMHFRTRILGRNAKFWYVAILKIWKLLTFTKFLLKLFWYVPNFKSLKIETMSQCLQCPNTYIWALSSEFVSASIPSC